MKTVRIGYIYDSKKLGKEEKTFLKLAKKMNAELIMFNLANELDEFEIEKKAKLCDVIYNDTADYITIEMAKTLEALGKKVIDATKIYYYTEDKWMFFLKCMQNKIPTPETILLSADLNSAKAELERFNHWPVILKRVYGERGEFVQKADNVNEAIAKITALWKKGNERLPVLAQEFIKSDSYRVTVIGKKIMQTAVKKCHGWKATGCYATRFQKFKMDTQLEKIVKKLVKVSGIEVCGIDLLKKNDKWLVLEINAEPSFNFFDNEREKLIRAVLQLLIKKA